jgi:hypothetical protein
MQRKRLRTLRGHNKKFIPTDKIGRCIIVHFNDLSKIVSALGFVVFLLCFLLLIELLLIVLFLSFLRDVIKSNWRKAVWLFRAIKQKIRKRHTP